MSLREQLLQYCATGIPEEPEVDLREIATMLLVDTVASEVENSESEFYLLRKAFLQPRQDICELFTTAISESGLDIEPELLAIEASLIPIIHAIDSHLEDGFTFAKMWEVDKKAACREILRSVGHGVSFWDDYDHQDFGQSDHPKVVDFESPYNEAYDVLTKFVSYIRSQLI